MLGLKLLFICLAFGFVPAILAPLSDNLSWMGNLGAPTIKRTMLFGNAMLGLHRRICPKHWGVSVFVGTILMWVLRLYLEIPGHMTWREHD